MTPMTRISFIKIPNQFASSGRVKGIRTNKVSRDCDETRASIPAI
jgi:hypothetical protein